MDGPDRDVPVDKTQCTDCRFFAAASRGCTGFAGVAITANRARLSAGYCGEWARRFEPRIGHRTTAGHRG